MKTNKFRVWDKKEQKFFEPVFEACNGELSELLISSNGIVLHRTLHGISMVDYQDGRWVVQSFTDLYAKDGKEIYEGDILIWHINDKHRMAPVYYDKNWGCFWMENVINDFGRGEYEVIGNIFQNPDLLKEQNHE